MKISAKGRYALRLMIDLARNDTGEWIALKDIARRQDISIKYMEQIVTLLSKAGLIRSSRGAAGGYKLVKPARDYTAGEIIRATEGTLAPVSCLEHEVNPCPRAASCPTLPLWEGLHRAVNQYLDSVTLEALAQNGFVDDGWDFSI